MKPESEDEPGINERGGVSSMADHAFGENDHVYSITHAPDNLSLVSFGQVYPPDDLQTALARLPLVPPGMGNPEEGSGVPPWILKAAWDLLFRRRGPKDTAAEQAAIQLLEEASKLQQKRKSESPPGLTIGVAARRTREFRCPAAVQMASLLRMPGPGGPTGRLEEGVDVTPLPIDESVVVAEDESEGVETNRCAEEVKVKAHANAQMLYLPPYMCVAAVR
ncbi:hypothetical protein AHF37_01427 [Paragonimus kellicotti]|nr:hypothetical protein AHF37_01427 [Paragonimus kellicotti]